MNLFNDLSGIEEIGIVNPINQNILYENGMKWIQNSLAVRPRTIWFRDFLEKPQIPKVDSSFKSQWVPMKFEDHRAFMHTGPFQALLSKGPISFAWMKAYSEFGKMVAISTYDENLESGGMAVWTLWKWIPVAPQRRAFMICHHSGVLPDLKRQLWFLGIQGDFYWLSDGKGATGGQWPSEIGEYTSYKTLLKDKIGALQITTDFIRDHYDLVITSHCMRYPLHFVKTGLPLIHVNSTRFGNEITTRPDEFRDLCSRIKSTLETGQLKIIHNNMADKWYFEQYIKGYTQFPVIPSLCISPLRFRITRHIGPVLIWDTRFNITDKKGSKLLLAISEKLGSKAESTSEMCVKKGGLLDDDFLNGFRAVIHIPYNISTMSCFEQVSANIPMWVPTPEFLERILADPEEHNELSWYCFQDTRYTAELADQVWNPAVIREYVSRCDFTRFKNVRFFNSIEDLLERIDTTDDDDNSLIQTNFMHQTKKRLDIMRQYREVLNLST